MLFLYVETLELIGQLGKERTAESPRGDKG